MYIHEESVQVRVFQSEIPFNSWRYMDKRLDLHCQLRNLKVQERKERNQESWRIGFWNGCGKKNRVCCNVTTPFGEKQIRKYKRTKKDTRFQPAKIANVNRLLREKKRSLC